MEKKRILVVDDDVSILTGLGTLLESEGYAVEAAADGRQALERFRAVRPDLVLLDVLMPEMSGLEVCRQLRREDREIPVVMLTAKGEESDKVLGLELGADDYVVKPFGTRELLARIKAALRRSGVPGQLAERCVCGELEIDFNRRRVRIRGEEVLLTAREFELLTFLVERQGQLVTREELLHQVWGYEHGAELDTRTVDIHVARLRRKLKVDPERPGHIATVHGAGYLFEGA